MIEKSSKIIFGIIASILFIIPILALPQAAGLSTSPTGVIIPLYTYPGTTWDQVIAEKTAHPSVPVVAIINPSSGPGTSKDTHFVTGIQKLKSAGITVIGYVYTSYASRSTSAVMADIDAYKNWYPVDGVMFDEMTNTVGHESYYSTISDYAKSRGFTLTVGNPGADVPSSYIGTVDCITIFEKSGLPSLSFLGGWHSKYDKMNFSAVSFGINSLDTAFVNSESQYVGYTYITNDVLPNPYNSLPPYMDTFVSALDANNDTIPISTSSTVSMDVNSVDSSGNAISGAGTTIQVGGTTVQSGSTPLSYSATSGTTYTVTVSNYQNYVFDHWNDGSTNPTRTVTPTQATTLTAYYTISQVSLNVNSVDSSGNAISGAGTTIQVGGTTVQSGSTPLSYSATSGTTYTVTVSNYQNYVFDHWNDGSTNPTRTVTPTQATTLTAYYTISQVSLNVNSVDSSGNAISGAGTTIQVGGTTVQSGSTPLSYSATSGTTYTVTVSNYQNYVFDHWNDGSTNPTRTVTPTQATTLTAYYTISQVSLNVNSVDSSGNAISGAGTTIQVGGTTVQSGSTPLSYSATSGTTYTVTVSNYQNYVFDHWNDGSTNPTRTVTPTQATTLTAYYTISQVSLNVNSVDSSGNAISGAGTTIQVGGTTVQSGSTPLSYSATSGTTYTVTVSNYQNYVFDHWNDGSTNPTRTVTPTQATTLTAYYKTSTTPAPITSTSKTVSLNVNSVNLSGGTISGMWTTIQTGSSIVKTGYTQLSYSATSGTTYTVTVSNYQNYVFDHWNDGSTNPTRTVTPTQATTLTAYYKTSTTPAPITSTSKTVSLNVNSVNLSGGTISGMWTTIQTGSSIVKTGYTQLSYSATSGKTYTVTVSNYQNYVFDHWNDGSTNPTRTVTPTQATTLTAYYKTSTTPAPITSTSKTVSLNVNSVNLSGGTISGMWTTIQTGSSIVKTGYTQLSYSATSGKTYTVTVSNYQNYVFDHWNDGSTNPTRTVTPTQATTLTAYYKT